MSVKFNEQLDYLNDFRIDESSGSVSATVEGLRAFNHVIRELDSLHLWEFAIKTTRVNYYNEITSYPLPTNYKEMIGLYEIQNFLDPFDRVKPVTFQRIINKDTSQPLVAEDYTDAVSTLKINFPNSKSFSTHVLNNSSYDGQGTWTATGNGASVATDSRVYLQYAGSVRFNVTSGAVGGITNSTVPAIDLSTYGPDYGMFFKSILPASVTSIRFRWGSSAANYYEKTVTTQFDGRSFKAGINQFGCVKQEATVTGSPDDAALTYFDIQLAAPSATLYGIRISSIIAATPDPLEFEHYSSDWVYDVSATAWVSKFDATDTANDYGAWSGRFDWFANVVNLGAASLVLREMQEEERAKDYRYQFIGAQYDSNSSIGGAVEQAMKRMPSRAKTARPPSIGLADVTYGNYYADP